MAIIRTMPSSTIFNVSTWDTPNANFFYDNLISTTVKLVTGNPSGQNSEIHCSFQKATKIHSLAITFGEVDSRLSIKSFEVHGTETDSNSGFVKLLEKSTETVWASGEKRVFNLPTNSKDFKRYKIVVTSNHGYSEINGAKTYIVAELEFKEVVSISKVLIFNNSKYKYYSSGWIDIDAHVDEQTYLNVGMNDLSIIPESAWSQLQGEVELCYYTDDPTKTEASFNIETDPFTLAEEWEDKEIKIIEYTDDPNQTESKITIETEPFTIYDELGDSVDVLYYTDDPSKTSAELNITANYSPLDELEGDFDVVTWTNDEEVIAGNRDMMLTYDALPFEQLIVQPTDIALYGDVKKVVATKVTENSPEGILRMAASFDSGLTWKTYRFNKWLDLDIQDTTLFKRKGMNLDTLNAIPEKDLIALTRIAYYFDSSKHYENSYSLDEVKMVVDAPRHAVEFRDMSLQLLNTTATIDLIFSGNKLTGVLDDADQGKVKYRVLLNGKTYYPADGNFTRLAASPFNIELNIDERNVNFGEENTLKVEFQDYWGAVDSREIKFIGSYSGLMFMDESGDFLSDTFGGILKQLDYGVIIAGQTTLTKKVRIKNLLGYAVDHVYLEMDKKFETDGVEVQLSRQADPFLPIDYLTYGLIQPEDSIDFYIRIATDIHAKPNPNGNFEMKVTADRV